MRGSLGLTSALVRAPALRAAIPFITGLMLGRWLAPGLVVPWVVVLCALSGWLYVAFRPQRYGLRWLNGAWLFVLLACFGVLWQSLRSPAGWPGHVATFPGAVQGWHVQIQEVASANGRTVRAWAGVHAAVEGGAARPASGGVLLTLLTDSSRREVQPGDGLVVSSIVVPIVKEPDPGGFDVRQWAASRGVFHEGFAPEEQWAFLDARPAVPGLFERIRTRITGWLRNTGLAERERALAKALLLGIRDEMDKDQNQDFVRSGTIHVLAVSGTHVGIIYVAVLWALVFLDKKRHGRLLRGAMALAALWAYAGITGFAPSVLRATVMFSLFTIAEMVRWRTSSLNSLACAAVLLLLWDPQMIDQLGFQLSFLAVLGIAVFYRPLHQVWAPPNAVAGFFWSLVVVSMAAQAFTTPLCLYVFQAFPVWFLPANMAIVGLVGVAVYGGIILLAVHAVPVLGALVSAVMKWLLLLLGLLAGFFAGLPAAYPAIRVGFWGMAGLYLLLAFGAIWLMQGHRWARTATMATLLLLLCGWGWTAHRRNGQRMMAVYSVRDGMACAFVQGRTLHAFGNVDDRWAREKVEAHARSVGAHRIVCTDSLPFEVDLGPDRFVLLAADRTAGAVAASPMRARSVVLYGPGRVDAGAIKGAPGAEWVLNANMGGKQRAWARSACRQQGAKVHDIRLNGAYVRP